MNLMYEYSRVKDFFINFFYHKSGDIYDMLCIKSLSSDNLTFISEIKS